MVQGSHQGGAVNRDLHKISLSAFVKELHICCRYAFDYSTANAPAKRFFRGFPWGFADTLDRVLTIAYRAHAMAKNIVIYQDEGTSEFGLRCLARFFKDDDVWFCTADAIIDGRVLGMADLFVMPGGADLPYCKKLNGAGNDNIRGFVELGGTYLGICAGAYYACRDIAYHQGRRDEICGPRELAFVPATATGSLPDLAPYYDETLASAAITDLRLANGETVQTLYHGGCRFDLSDGHDCDILATYAQIAGNPPAIIRQRAGFGRAILSGVHFEMTPGCLADYPVKTESEKDTLARLRASFKNDYSVAAWQSALLWGERAG